MDIIKIKKKIVGRIGITAAQPKLKQLPILVALKLGLKDSINMTIEWLQGLKSFFIR